MSSLLESKKLSKRSVIAFNFVVAVIALAVFILIMDVQRMLPGVRKSHRALNSEINTDTPVIGLTATTRKMCEDTHEMEIRVRFDGVKDAHPQDFVSISCGESNDHLDHMKAISSNQQTDGEVVFHQMFPHRCQYMARFVKYRPEFDTFMEASRVLVEIPVSLDAPTQGSLSFTSNMDEMMVIYNTRNNRSGFTRYGVVSQQLNLTASGVASTYSASDLCDAPANIVSQDHFRDPGFTHKIILKGLVPSTKYYYQFGNDNDGWSNEYFFIARPVTTANTTTKFIAFADMGVVGGERTTDLVKQDSMEHGYNTFVILFGDISYAMGTGSVWDIFFNMIARFATYTPCLMSVGNHDFDYVGENSKDPSLVQKLPSGEIVYHRHFRPWWGRFGNDNSRGECGVPIYHRTHTPSNGHSLFWYSFDYGNVHVIQMSTEHDFRPGSPQYEWVERDLANVDRSKTPWIVLTGHRMMYTTQADYPLDNIISHIFRGYFEDLLYKYRVDIMLVGHQHSYERSCRLYRGRCQKGNKGTMHFVAGMGGTAVERSGFSSFLGGWSEFHVNENGYLRIQAVQDKKLVVEFVQNQHYRVIDSVEIFPWSS